MHRIRGGTLQKVYGIPWSNFTTRGSCRISYICTLLTPSQDSHEDIVEVLHIAGADLLWRIILNANDENLAAATIDLLVQEYLDVCPSTL